jgi:hypothetical protein
MKKDTLKPMQSGLSGQAMTELVILLLIMIPVVLVLPILGGVLDIQFKVHEAARYVSWERTVWAENKKIAAQEGEVIKESSQLEKETAHLFFRSPLVAVHQKYAMESHNIVDNSLWKGYRHSRLIGDDFVASKKLRPLEKESARFHLKERQSKTPGINIMDAMSGQSVAGFKLGLPFSGKSSLARLEIERPLNEVILFGNREWEKSTQTDNQGDSSAFKPILKSKGAILSQVWSVPDEKRFSDTVRTLVADGMTLALGAEQIGYAFKLFSDPLPGKVFLFKEIDHAFRNKTALTPNEMSRVLPDYASHEVTRPRKSLTVDFFEWIVP